MTLSATRVSGTSTCAADTTTDSSIALTTSVNVEIAMASLVQRDRDRRRAQAVARGRDLQVVRGKIDDVKLAALVGDRPADDGGAASDENFGAGDRTAVRIDGAAAKLRAERDAPLRSEKRS